MNIKPGDIVEWTSQSQGVAKTKRGKVLAIVPKETEINLHPLLASVPGSRIKFETLGFYMKPSINDRAVVEVPRGGRSKLSDYYAPKLKWLKKVEMDEHPNDAV